MDESKVKVTMDQIHISPKMQEEIIWNVRYKTENGKIKTGNLRKMVTAAAAFVVMAGIVSFPVRALVISIVEERMEAVPKEELRDLNDMIQSQYDVQADGFSREYSASEKERDKALWKAYENGTFPEKVIAQADSVEAAPEGTLCYIRSTGIFQLPAQEMTDEEILEIIDFQHKMSYAVTHSGVVTEEEKAAYRAKIAGLQKRIQDADGINEDEAVEIARKQLKADLGAKADGLELMTDHSGNGATLCDTSEEGYEEIESKAGVAYDVGFGNPDDHSTYGYIIDAVDGSILYTY